MFAAKFTVIYVFLLLLCTFIIMYFYCFAGPSGRPV